MIFGHHPFDYWYNGPLTRKVKELLISWRVNVAHPRITCGAAVIQDRSMLALARKVKQDTLLHGSAVIVCWEGFSRSMRITA